MPLQALPKTLRQRKSRAEVYWFLPIPKCEREVYRQRGKAYGISGARLLVAIGRTWLANPTRIELLLPPQEIEEDKDEGSERGRPR